MDPNLLQLSDQEIARRESLEEIKSLGINPYPAEEFKVTAYSQEIIENYSDEAASQKQEVSVAGRIMSRRIMGKASFVELQDSKGRIQLYISRDDLCHGEDKSLYNNLFKKCTDIGDYIGVSGYVFRTQMGEISIHVESLQLLSKALRPLPIVKSKDGKVFDGFSDPEQRYRHRYVDLIVNPEVKKTFITRSRIITAMRHIFDKAGYLEVETPILQPIPGGASARPFVTHHNTLDVPLYLRIADELYLKRLIVGGFDGVYEFGKNFRNEGMDRTHNPEYTCVELYVAYKDYHWMMQFIEKTLEQVCLEVLGTTKVVVEGKEIDFKAPYPRVPILEAIKEHTGIDVSGMDEKELRDVCKQLGIEVNETMGKGKLIDEIFGETCEKHYLQPTFITDYPIEMSPLTKKHRSNPELTERFELMVHGKEIANAYSELNDPIDQRKRFEDQLRLSARGDDEAMYIDQDFLMALEYGMPPTSGVGIGVDRLVMMLTGQDSIQEVLFFPQMKPEPQLKKDKAESYIAKGIAKELVPLLQKAGYLTADSLEEAKPARVLQQLVEINKKYKLGIDLPSLEETSSWSGQKIS